MGQGHTSVHVSYLQVAVAHTEHGKGAQVW